MSFVEMACVVQLTKINVGQVKTRHIKISCWWELMVCHPKKYKTKYKTFMIILQIWIGGTTLTCYRSTDATEATDEVGKAFSVLSWRLRAHLWRYRRVWGAVIPLTLFWRTLDILLAFKTHIKVCSQKIMTKQKISKHFETIDKHLIVITRYFRYLKFHEFFRIIDNMIL